MAAPSDPVSVALVATPEASPYALYGLHEVLSAAGVAWAAAVGQPPPNAPPPFAVSVVAAAAGPQRIFNGVPAIPDASFADDPRAEVVIVPSLEAPVADDPRGRWPEAAAWIARRAAAGATVASVCSGALILAEAGLLDGRDATTHWAYADALARFYPEVQVRADRIMVLGDPEGRIVTTGGAAAWEDLALWLVARHAGPEEATRLGKLFLFGDRGDGQLPFASLLPRAAGEDAAVAAAQAWAAEHYAEPGAAAGMAAASGLAPRTFARRLRKATGYAPLEYLQTLRVEEAKWMLERSDLPADEVAAEVGWEDPAQFRRVFRRLVGVTPGAYRRRFRRPAA